MPEVAADANMIQVPSMRWGDGATSSLPPAPHPSTSQRSLDASGAFRTGRNARLSYVPFRTSRPELTTVQTFNIPALPNRWVRTVSGRGQPTNRPLKAGRHSHRKLKLAEWIQSWVCQPRSQHLRPPFSGGTNVWAGVAVERRPDAEQTQEACGYARQTTDRASPSGRRSGKSADPSGLSQGQPAAISSM